VVLTEVQTAAPLNAPGMTALSAPLSSAGVA
jgi:hypothetical protein